MATMGSRPTCSTVMPGWPSPHRWWSFLAGAWIRSTLPTRLDPIRRCAIRETTEETGVVLAETDLHPWAHWITPEIEPRRYDTRFFVAAMPADQNAADISGETEHADWSTPQAALAAERSGVIRMLPPTMSILIELADLPTVAEVINHVHERQIEPVLPGLVEDRSGWRFRYPQRRSGETSIMTSADGSGCGLHPADPSSQPRPDDPGRNQHLGDQRSKTEGALVVDPGPAIQAHLEAILAACEPRLVTIVLTHRHLDHSEGAAMLAERAGCGVRAADPQFRIGPDGLEGGQLITIGATDSRSARDARSHQRLAFIAAVRA